MANQYTGSFENLVQAKFGTDAKTFLEQCLADGLSYTDVQSKLGVSETTARKWSKRFGIELEKPVRPEADDKYQELFYDKQINAVNLLSRSWSR